MYVSSLPGRLRIRTDDDAVLQLVAEAVGKLGGILDVRHNPRTGSLLVLYEQSPVTMDGIATLRQEYGLVPTKTEGNARAVSPVSAAGKTMGKAAKMTIAKRGMVCTLGLAMAFALLDREDGHIVSGAMFLGFLSYHLYVYRKRVLA